MRSEERLKLSPDVRGESGFLRGGRTNLGIASSVSVTGEPRVDREVCYDFGSRERGWRTLFF